MPALISPEGDVRVTAEADDKLRALGHDDLMTSRPLRSPHPLVALLLAVALLSSGCSWAWGTNERVEGSGTSTTEATSLDAFNAIEVQSDLVVVVEFGDATDGIEVTTDDNLHDYLEPEVRGSTLILKPRRNTTLVPSAAIVVDVGDASLERVRAESDSEVTTPLLTASTVRLETSSDGKLDTSVAADELFIDASSDGQVDASGDATMVTVLASSDATVKLDLSAGEVEVDASSDAVVELEGSASTLDLRASSDATTKSVMADVVDADVDASSDATIELIASGTVRGEASSDAEVTVAGATSVEVDTSSGASVDSGG